MITKKKFSAKLRKKSTFERYGSVSYLRTLVIDGISWFEYV